MKRLPIEVMPAAAIVIAVTAAYISSFSGVFIFDDYAAIFKNPNVTGSNPFFSMHRWLVDLTFRVNVLISGFDPWSYHFLNLLIHLGSVLFVYGAVRRTILNGLNVSGAALKDAGLRAALFAAAAAVIWGIHPLTTQSVTYICQRYESLMAFFMFASIYTFIRGIEGRSARVWFDLSLVMLVSGMACKEVMVVVPLLLLLYDYVFGGYDINTMVRRRGMFHVASFGTILVLMMYQMHLAAGQISGVHQGGRVGELSWWQYLYAQGGVIVHYLRLSVWPSGLCFDYDWRFSAADISGLSSLGLHALVFASGLAGLIRRRWWGFVVIMFYLVLAPTSSVVPVADLAAEHRMYVPLAAVVIMFLWVMNRTSARLAAALKVSSVHLFVIMVILIAALLGTLTFKRNMVYSSEVGMWRDVVARRPENLRARNDLASALSEAGDLESALIEYYEVMSRVPEPLRSKLDRGEAMVTGWFRKSSPEYAYFVAAANLGTMYCNESRDYPGAFVWYLTALRVAPFNDKVRQSAKNVLRAYGHAEDDLDAVLNAAITESIKERRVK